MRQGARGWCTGMTQRDGMGREVRGGFRMGNTCTPVADSCQVWQKPLQYCKVKINKNEKKINKGWYGEGGGKRVQDGEHMYTCGGFILIFGKTKTIM